MHTAKAKQTKSLVSRGRLAVLASAVSLLALAVPAAAQTLTVGIAQFGTESAAISRLTVPEVALYQGTFEYLQMRDPKTWQPIPGLATAIEPSQDQKVWTVTLREGVPFHDGYGMMTSADVKFSYEQATRSDSINISNGLLKGRLESIETPDDKTVVFTFKEPFWQFSEVVAQASGYVPILSKKHFDEVGEDKAARSPVGTGPYDFVEGVSGQQLKFQAVAEHWRVVPQFKELVLRRITERATAVSALLAGEIDVAQISSDYIDQVKGAGFRVHDAPDATFYTIILPGQTVESYPDYCPTCEWVGDPKDPASLERARKVRMAMNMAINRPAIYEGIFRGYAKDTPFAPFYLPVHPGYRSSWTLPAFDLEGAKALMAEAGYPNGFTVKINASGDPIVGHDVVDAVASDLAKIGVKIERVNEDMGTFLAKVRARNTGGVGRTYYSPVSASQPISIYAILMNSKGAGYYIAEGPYDADIAKVLHTLDEKERVELQSALGEKIYQAHHSLDIGTVSVTWGVSDKIGEWPTAPAGRTETNYEYMTVAK